MFKQKYSMGTNDDVKKNNQHELLAACQTIK